MLIHLRGPPHFGKQSDWWQNRVVVAVGFILKPTKRGSPKTTHKLCVVKPEASWMLKLAF